MGLSGLFVTFEGLDGSGKTTQMRVLAQRLRGEGETVLETAEPGGTRIGLKIRDLLLNPENCELVPRAELLLYFAARAQNVAEAIRPALAKGEVVLCDRFTDSTMVYQGAARGLGEDVVLTLDRIACEGLRPQLTICVDIDMETGLSRAYARNAKRGGDRMDEQSSEFHSRVRDGYHRLAIAEPERVKVVDGRGSVEQVAGRIWDTLLPVLSSRRTATRA